MLTLAIGKESSGHLRGFRVFLSSAESSVVYSFRVSLGALRVRIPDDRVNAAHDERGAVGRPLPRSVHVTG